MISVNSSVANVNISKPVGNSRVFVPSFSSSDTFKKRINPEGVAEKLLLNLNPKDWKTPLGSRFKSDVEIRTLDHPSLGKIKVEMNTLSREVSNGGDALGYSFKVGPKLVAEIKLIDKNLSLSTMDEGKAIFRLAKNLIGEQKTKKLQSFCNDYKDKRDSLDSGSVEKGYLHTEEFSSSESIKIGWEILENQDN